MQGELQNSQETWSENASNLELSEAQATSINPGENASPQKASSSATVEAASAPSLTTSSSTLENINPTTNTVLSSSDDNQSAQEGQGGEAPEDGVTCETDPSTSQSNIVITEAAEAEPSPILTVSGQTTSSCDIPESSHPVASSDTITAHTSPPESTILASTSSQVVSSEVAVEPQQGQKRKEPEDVIPETTASTSSQNQSTKRFKVSDTIIDCEVALEVLGGLNYFDHWFLKSGKVLAWALQPDDPNFSRIDHYFTISQSPAMPMKILSIIQIITNVDKMIGDGDAPFDFNQHPNAAEMYRKMLWHGTMRWNVSSILEDGFHAPFPGRGIFFADRVALSRYFCSRGFFDSSGYLFLCDVLLGNKDAWNDATVEAISTVGNFQCRSSKRFGYTIPDKNMDTLVDGCIWPLGGSIREIEGAPLYLYNEYVVYNEAQIRPKFLVKFKFM